MDEMKMKDYKERLSAESRHLTTSINRSKVAAEEIRSENTEDEGDLATMSHNKDVLFKLQESDFLRLKFITEALEAIERGQYGECVRCEEEISEKRLMAVPWATLCLACQEKAERECIPSHLVLAGAEEYEPEL